MELYTNIIVADTTNIEAKALNEFRRYLEDSTVVQPFINDNDKEPSWDGFLYVYSDGIKDKSHYNCRVPIQVKGHEVDYFKDSYKEKIDVNDLKAYLTDPVVYVVCLIKKNSKERCLLYRNLLPETIKNILKGKDKLSSVSVLMKPFPENREDFEKLLTVFNGDKIKQIPFAHKPAMSIQDLKNRKIRHFQFAAPTIFKDNIQMMRYLSKTPTSIYAQINAQYDISVPIEGGEALLTFNQKRDIEVKSGGRLFYHEVCTEVKDGVFSVIIGKVLRLELPDENSLQITIHINCESDNLDERINEAEFILTLHETSFLELGERAITLHIPDGELINSLRSLLPGWKALQQLLKVLHVTKPIDLSQIKPEHGKLIEMLYDGIVNQKSIIMPHAKTQLYVFDIANIHLLCWVLKEGESNACTIGDFFDGRLQISYAKDDKHYLQSPFSYLRESHLWERIDNIPYERQVSEYEKLAKENKEIYDMANHDALWMIKAADAVSAKDNERRDVLLKYAHIVCQWLIEKDDREGLHNITYKINSLQIIKRQRALNPTEIEELKGMILDESIGEYSKVGVAALLEDKESFERYKQQLSSKDFSDLCNMPISMFFPK